MNDRAVCLLEQYNIEVLHTRKGRGAILCDTPEGCLIFKEYNGSEDKILLQDRLLRHIEETGTVQAEKIIPTTEGALSVKDGDGISYVLKTYSEGRECNIFDAQERKEIVHLLAQLHLCMELPRDVDWIPAASSPGREFDKRNRELKKVRKYLQQRSQKTWFEICLLNSFNLFLNQAMEVTSQWKAYEDALDYAGRNTYCHGDFQYHNILRKEDKWFVVNFEKCIPDSPMRDLYLLMRKLLEKSSWSVALGRELVTEYSVVRPISAAEQIELYYRLAYPEKFWKIVNFYYNSGKAWIPERNREKLDKLIRQEKEKQAFLDEVFRTVG